MKNRCNESRDESLFVVFLALTQDKINDKAGVKISDKFIEIIHPINLPFMFSRR